MTYQQDAYGFRTEIPQIEETVEEQQYRKRKARERKLRKWRQSLETAAFQAIEDGYEAEIVECSEHPMGCYLRVLQRPEAFEEAMADAFQVMGVL